VTLAHDCRRHVKTHSCIRNLTPSSGDPGSSGTSYRGGGQVGALRPPAIRSIYSRSLWRLRKPVVMLRWNSMRPLTAWTPPFDCIAGVDVGQERLPPLSQNAPEAGDLGDRAGGE
jgi:hypothetical protein